MGKGTFYFPRFPIGSFEAGDQGLAGATVTLLQGSTEIATQVTGSDGSYVFGNLAAGTYTVQLPASSLGNRTATTATSFSVTLVQDQQNGDVDFGVTPTPTDPQNNASIGDLVFEDLDGDGAFGTGEPGLAGINLALFQGSTEIATQTTASDGSYLFDNLAAGNYRVELLSSGLDDYETTTATTVDVVLAEGQANTSADFGAKALSPGTASIGDLVFEDANGNGVLDGDEVGIANATVRLVLDSNEIATVSTNASGQYSFEQLRAGDYMVQLVPDSLNGRAPTTVTSFNVSIADGEQDNDVDFGVGTLPPTTTGFDEVREFYSKSYSPAAFVALAASLSNSAPIVSESFTIIDTGFTKYAFKPKGISVFGAPDLRLFGAFPGNATVQQLEDNFGTGAPALNALSIGGEVTIHTLTPEELGLSAAVPQGAEVVVATTGVNTSVVLGVFSKDDFDSTNATNFTAATLPVPSQQITQTITVKSQASVYATFVPETLEEIRAGARQQLLAIGFNAVKADAILNGLDLLTVDKSEIFTFIKNGGGTGITGFSKLMTQVNENIDNPQANQAFELRQTILILKNQLNLNAFGSVTLSAGGNTAGYDLDIAIAKAGSTATFATGIQAKVASTTGLLSVIENKASTQLKDAPADTKIFQVMLRDITIDQNDLANSLAEANRQIRDLELNNKRFTQVFGSEIKTNNLELIITDSDNIIIFDSTRGDQ